MTATRLPDQSQEPGSQSVSSAEHDDIAGHWPGVGRRPTYCPKKQSASGPLETSADHRCWALVWKASMSAEDRKKRSRCSRYQLTFPAVEKPRAVHKHVAPISNRLTVVFNLDLPLRTVLVPDGTNYSMLELDVLAKIVLVAKVDKVVLDLGRVLHANVQRERGCIWSETVVV